MLETLAWASLIATAIGILVWFLRATSQTQPDPEGETREMMD